MGDNFHRLKEGVFVAYLNRTKQGSENAVSRIRCGERSGVRSD